MPHYTILEWSSLPISAGPAGTGEVTRQDADILLGIAGRAAHDLKLGGENGDHVLADGRAALRARQIVGILNGPGVGLEILPKIDGLDTTRTRKNLVHMLARVLDLPISSGIISDLDWQRYDLLEIVIRLFCDLTFKAVHRGLPRRYIGHHDDLPQLRGRLDVIRQFTVRAANPDKLSCNYDELSPDITLNRVIKAAIRFLRQYSRVSENQRKLFELTLAFSEVTDVSPQHLAWHEIVIDRTNRDWVTILNLAALILGKRFQTTTFGDGKGFSLLFEMNTLFEEFVGRNIHKTQQALGHAISLQGPRRFALRDEGGSPRFATRPDIVIHGTEGAEWIVDTKWKILNPRSEDAKHGISQADVYQMMAYAHVYRCPNLMLLYPHHSALGETAGRIAEFTVSGTDRTRLVIATVDLTDLNSLDRQLYALFSNPSIDVEVSAA
jgi:5-methylcytosine-specific restriction enzyme subunit McrC